MADDVPVVETKPHDPNPVYDSRKDPSEVIAALYNVAPDEKPETPVDQDVTPARNDVVLRLARDAGIENPDDYTDDQLRGIVTAFNRKLAAQPAPPLSPTQLRTSEPEEPEPLKLELSDDLDPELRKTLSAAFETAHKSYSRQIGEMKKSLADADARSQQLQTVLTLQAFDKHVEGWGDDFADLFGKGETASMLAVDPNGTASRNRLSVLQEAARLDAARRSVPGLSPMSATELFRFVRDGLFGAQVSKKLTDKAQSAVKDRAKIASAKPAASPAKDRPLSLSDRDMAAHKAAAEVWRKHTGRLLAEERRG